MIFEIYLLGFLIALCFVVREAMDFCFRNKIDFRQEFKNIKVIKLLLLYSCGSWLTVAHYLFVKKD